MSEKPRTRATRRHTPPAKRRRPGQPGKPLEQGSPGGSHIPPPPAPARPGRKRTPPLVTWRHLMVDGSDAEFRRMVRALAALMHRLDEVCDLAARSVGLTGVQLALLLAIVEADADGDGVTQYDIAREIGADVQYVRNLANRLVKIGMVAKRPDPAHRQRKLVSATAAGRAAVAAATPLIKAAHNVAFQPLDGRAFEHLREIAAALDGASAMAVDILARRTGEELDTSIRELRRLARRLGAEF